MRSDRQSAWWTMDGGSWHWIGDRDQDHPHGKEMQILCLIHWHLSVFLASCFECLLVFTFPPLGILLWRVHLWWLLGLFQSAGPRVWFNSCGGRWQAPMSSANLWLMKPSFHCKDKGSRVCGWNFSIDMTWKCRTWGPNKATVITVAPGGQSKGLWLWC